ncbi:hypothetical protein ACJX0J_008560, partial [Zea mays]
FIVSLETTIMHTRDNMFQNKTMLTLQGHDNINPILGLIHPYPIFNTHVVVLNNLLVGLICPLHWVFYGIQHNNGILELCRDILNNRGEYNYILIFSLMGLSTSSNEEHVEQMTTNLARELSELLMTYIILIYYIIYILHNINIIYKYLYIHT